MLLTIRYLEIVPTVSIFIFLKDPILLRQIFFLFLKLFLTYFTTGISFA